MVNKINENLQKWNKNGQKLKVENGINLKIKL